MKNTVSHSRWEKAQTYEKNFWNTFADKQCDQDSTQFDWYQQRAQQILHQAQPFLKSLSVVRALEIGSGPIGVINYLACDERYAIDPLEDYYKSRPELINSRDSRVNYLQGTGEDISSLGKVFSLIIIDNVLDHVKDPQLVLIEINKNLETGGIMFISLNIYTKYGVRLRNLMELFQIDRGHPFNFSQYSISLLIKKCGFDILHHDTEEYRAQKKRYRKTKNAKHILKSYLGLTDFRFSAFCKKL